MTLDETGHHRNQMLDTRIYAIIQTLQSYEVPFTLSPDQEIEFNNCNTHTHSLSHIIQQRASCLS